MNILSQKVRNQEPLRAAYVTDELTMNAEKKKVREFMNKNMPIYQEHSTMKTYDCGEDDDGPVIWSNVYINQSYYKPMRN